MTIAFSKNASATAYTTARDTRCPQWRLRSKRSAQPHVDTDAARVTWMVSVAAHQGTVLRPTTDSANAAVSHTTHQVRRPARATSILANATVPATCTASVTTVAAVQLAPNQAPKSFCTRRKPGIRCPKTEVVRKS